MEGQVVSVEEHTAGSELAVAASTTDTEIEVVDIDEFDEDGSLQIGDEIIAYTVEEDSEGTIDLADPLASSYSVEQVVSVWPYSVERLAYVVVPDQEEEIQARVPHALYEKLATGIREEGQGETVKAFLDDDEYVIEDVLSQEPQADAAFVVSAPGVALTKFGGQTISNTTSEPLTWETVEFDTEELFDPSTDEVVVIDRAGVYAVGILIIWAPNGTGRREVAIIRERGGVDKLVGADILPNPSGTIPSVQSETVVEELQVDDEISIRVWQNSGGNLILRDQDSSLSVGAGSGINTKLAIYRLGGEG